MRYPPKNNLFLTAIFLATLLFFTPSLDVFAEGGPCPSSSGEKTREKRSGGGGVSTGVVIDITGLLKKARAKKKAKLKECCEFENIYIKNTWTKNQDVDVIITSSAGAQTKRIPAGKTFMFSGDLGKCVRVTVKSTDPNAPYLLIEDVSVCCADLEKGKDPGFLEIDIVDYTAKACVVAKPPTEKPAPPEKPKAPPVPPEKPKGPPVPPEKPKGPPVPPEKPKEPPTPPEKPKGPPVPPEKPKEPPVPPEEPKKPPVPPEKPKEPPLPPEEPLTPEKPGKELTPEKPEEPLTPERPEGPGPTVEREPQPPQPPRPPAPPPKEPPPTEKPPPVIPRLGIDITKCSPLWLPQQGNAVQFTAKIYKWVPGIGWSYPGLPRVITFKLSQVSREKGICMNKGEQTTPDLYFKSPQADFVFSGGEGTFYDTATTTRAVTEATVIVSSDDFGSFGKIKSSASGCEDIAPNGPVSIPLDNNRNTIADRAAQDDSGAPPQEDKDANPRLDGYPGDGYSNYEEYRGFFVRGAHRRTDIARKDFLINDQIGQGVGNYAKTQISVHLVANDELRNREANFNRGHATTGAQHGIILKMNTGEIPTNIGGRSVQNRINDGIMGPPKNVTATVLNGWSPSLVAHELGHSTCVWHHGDVSWDFTTIWILEDSAFYNNPLVYGARQAWRDFWGEPPLTLCGYTLPRDFRFHPKGAQQSGDVDCLMRYVGFFEVYSDNGMFACWPSPDIQGNNWCTSKAGTGYNSGGLVGGDANKGNCLGQLRVNDK